MQKKDFESYVQAQLNFQSILDQLFSLYSTVLGQVFSRTSLEVLRKYPTPERVIAIKHIEIVEMIHTGWLTVNQTVFQGLLDDTE
ncbi:hypothetical protein [Paenibacillus luteus]|uniref:hypothetical protein n=1 Tax=Paenibacillus luteus TaxID=2545753 RepID=UPI0019D52A72|nr:hypothetical protein [Paenibacillus luteus]